MRKRIIAALMTLCMALSLLPGQVLAAGVAQTGGAETAKGTGRVYVNEPDAQVALLQRTMQNPVTDEAALAAAIGQSGTVTLGADIRISSTLVIPKDTYAVLDLNGYVLQMTGSGSVFRVEREGDLTVKDTSTDNRAHTFTVGSDGVWALDDGGEKTVTGGVITGGDAEYGGGVYIERDGKFALEGGSIVGCRASACGGGVYIERDGWFTLESGGIMGCRAGEYGGGVYSDRVATMTMTGGEITGCAAKESTSAGLYIAGGRLSANGGTVKDEVFCVGTIDSATGKTGCTEFQAQVTNQKIAAGGGWLNGLIRHGNFRGTVLNQNGGGIDGGTFLGDVENIDASLGAGITGSGGTFYGKVTNGSKDGPAKSARIRGGMFRGEVTNETSGMISGGTFYEGIVDEGGEVRGHTVTYKIGETVYAQQVVSDNGTAADPAENRDGYLFDGWYNGTEKYDFSTPVTEALTLTGQWRVNLVPADTEKALRDALANGAADIRLAADINIDKTVVITGELTLDLNGYVLQMTGSGSVFELSGGGKLTVVDSRPAAAHRFTPNAAQLWVLDETGGTETVNGGIITGGSANRGGGVNVENGTLIMEGGSIVGCQAVYTYAGGSGSGGGVRVSVDGSFEMYQDAGIYGCVASGYGEGDGSGGGVEIDGGGSGESGTFVMHGGTIASCVAGRMGGGVGNDGVFIMEDGAIRSCSAIGNDGEEAMGGSIRFSGDMTVSGGTISAPGSTGKQHIFGRGAFTISGNAQIDVSMTLDGTLYANGGTIAGGVMNSYGTITGSEGAAGTTTFTGAVVNDGTIRGGVFEGEVTNKEDGTIKDGTFKKKMENEGTIEGGTFEDTVRSRTRYGAQKAAVIRDGTFNGPVESYSGIENGVFAGTVESEGTISGGTFKDAVMNKVGSTIRNGRFTGAVENNGTITDGIFEGALENRGTITGGAFHGEVTCDGRVDNGSHGPLVGGTVSGGSFDQTIQVIFGTIIGEEYAGKWDGSKPSVSFLGEKHTLTYQADGKDYAWQVLGKDFFPVMPQGPDKEGYTFLTWVYDDGVDKGEMIDEGVGIRTDRTAVARYAAGSGTEQDPCRIGSREELELFRMQVNRYGRTDLCAVLTSDIVMNSGTFNADGRYTPAAGETARGVYPIGSEKQPYTGTFDGGGYTIRGLCVARRGYYDGESFAAANYVGLFGGLSGATVKNLTVTGYVDGRFYVGGIAGYADDTTKLLNCRSECIVVSGKSTHPYASDPESVIRYAGGIVGYNKGSVTACCNAGTVTGIDSVGGITGGGPGTVSDCYNVGAVTASGQNAGGIAGNGGTVSYSYNVGTVTGGAEIANNAAVNDCCFLGAAGQTAGAFADGTVLAALIAGRGQHPWGDACCPPLGGTAGLTAQPVLRWQQQTLTADTSDAALLCGKTQAVRPVGGAFGTLTYTSSDPAVASIENGVITAHKAGTVTITAEASATGGYYASTAGYRLTVSHDYTEKRDAGYHWQTCVCGDVTAKTAHHWVNGACEDCGYACGHADREIRDAKKATCTGDGYTGDTYCKTCGDKVQSGTVLKATGHTGGTATCTSAAVCRVCGQTYGGKDAANHSLKHTAAKEPGVFVSGHIEYWQCRRCGRYFADAGGTREIPWDETIIPRERQSEESEPVKAPGTGDAGIALYGVTALLSLGGCAWLRRKKK